MYNDFKEYINWCKSNNLKASNYSSLQEYRLYQKNRGYVSWQLKKNSNF